MCQYQSKWDFDRFKPVSTTFLTNHECAFEWTSVTKGDAIIISTTYRDNNNNNNNDMMTTMKREKKSTAKAKAAATYDDLITNLVMLMPLTFVASYMLGKEQNRMFTVTPDDTTLSSTSKPCKTVVFSANGLLYFQSINQSKLFVTRAMSCTARIWGAGGRQWQGANGYWKGGTWGVFWKYLVCLIPG